MSEAQEIDGDGEEDGGTARRYRAPALEKGLDILELLARAPTGLTLAQIVQTLARSHGELFRMVQVLQYRGYIDQPVGDGAYRLTDRLFALGMEQPQTRSLVETALPVMRRLALALGQSCHLAFHSQGEIVVVARMESGEQIGFAVRVGYRRPMIATASGVVLFAFQAPETQAAWLAAIRPAPPPSAIATFRAECDAACESGHVSRPSSYVDGVTDLSAPVLRGAQAAAAFTVPFLVTRQLAVSMEAAIEQLSAAAAEVSAQMVHGDNRA